MPLLFHKGNNIIIMYIVQTRGAYTPRLGNYGIKSYTYSWDIGPPNNAWIQNVGCLEYPSFL